MRVVAFVTDLLDRSKIARALPGVHFAGDPSEAAGADVVVVDLTRHPASVMAARQAAPGARIVGYGHHTAADVLDRALRDGADAALPRSRFFHDPAAALGDVQTSGQG